MLEKEWNYGICGFCKCRTNAKMRMCCNLGYNEDFNNKKYENNNSNNRNPTNPQRICQ